MSPSPTDYPNLRSNLNPVYAGLSDRQIKGLLNRNGMDAEAMEGFFDDFGKVASSIGKVVLKAAPSILPVAGTILGTVVGGPMGASLGGSLGKLAGGAIGAATGQGPAPPGGLAGGIASGLGSVAGAIPGLGGSAAGQLLNTFMKPQTLQAVSRMALGPLANPNVPVGGTSVPVGAFGNLLSVLTGRAEAEYNASAAAVQGPVPKYMQDYAGEATGDPAVSDHRAKALYELLEAEAAQESAEGAEAAESYSYQSEAEAIQAEYDAMEQMEIEMAEAELYESESD